MLRDHAYLLDIYTSAKAAISYLEDTTFAGFERDRKTQKALICELLIIGEVSKKISLRFRAENNKIPWSFMARMRDKLVHDYDEAQPLLLWNTAKRSAWLS